MSLQNIIQRMYKKLALPLTAETISNMSRNVAQAVVAEVKDKKDYKFTQNTLERVFWNSVLNAVDKETMDTILQGLDLFEDYDEFVDDDRVRICIRYRCQLDA